MPNVDSISKHAQKTHKTVNDLAAVAFGAREKEQASTEAQNCDLHHIYTEGPLHHEHLFQHTVDDRGGNTYKYSSR